jgi:putative ABC transport system ATP-binding protein
MQPKEKIMALVELKDVTKNYQLGKTTISALRSVSFDVFEGDFLSIVGPSGCGKTTTLNIIGCIDKPTNGSVLFKGRNLASFSDNEEAETRLDNIGFIFQSFNLIPVLNIFENIEFPLIIAGMAKKKRKSRVEELIETVELQEYYRHRPDELSGGQRQRVAIARALVNKPSLVIADEPTANLDSETGAIILKAMKKLNDDDKVTFIFSTHNEDVMAYAKRIIHLKDGRIISEEEK